MTTRSVNYSLHLPMEMRLLTHLRHYGLQFFTPCIAVVSLV